jgi:ribosomal protein S18 acetylase RimI-like enzyme
MTSIVIRPYAPDDREALYDICVRTGDGGQDARHQYTDQRLMGDIFAVPYAELEPELTFVADDGGQAVGYVLGTADTVAFAHEFRRRWLPRVADRHPAPSGPPGPDASPTERMVRLLHTPERMIVPGLEEYPAHLHIDLLPAYQRMGLGRTLIETFLGALRERGVSALHLGMVSTNAAARAFYDRTGFHEIPIADSDPVTYLGIRV